MVPIGRAPPRWNFLKGRGDLILGEFVEHRYNCYSNRLRRDGVVTRLNPRALKEKWMSDEEHYATHVAQSIPHDVAEPIKSKRRLKYKQPSNRSLLGLGMLVEKMACHSRTKKRKQY